MDSVPNLRSQLKLAYHKVMNYQPSKNQIETDRRGAQRPGRRRDRSKAPQQERDVSQQEGDVSQRPGRLRSKSRTPQQEGVVGSSSAVASAALAHSPQSGSAQPAKQPNSCCASAAVEHNMTLRHAHTPQRDAAQTANHQSSCCASTTVEDNVTLPHPAMHSFRPPPGLENEVSRNEFPMMMLPRKVYTGIFSLLTMDVRGFRCLVASWPFWLKSPADFLQKSMATLAQTCCCCSELRRVHQPCVAAARIDKAARMILAMDIVVNDRTYRFSEVVPILLSSSWPWACFAEDVQTDKLYTLEPRGPYH